METIQVREEEVNALFPTFDKALTQDIVTHSILKTFAEGEKALKPGQNIKSTILVLEGLIKIFREDENGNEIFMYYLKPGQACALSMMKADKYKTSEIKATAVRETEVLAIPVRYVDQWMKEHPTWHQFVLSTYNNRFEELLTTIDEVAFRNMDERLALYLAKHRRIANSNIISITHARIATELNTSREVISRLLKKLAEKGFIKISRQHIEIVNPNYFSA